LNNCKKCDTGLDVFQIDETPNLMVKGREVGINDLDGIMKEVHELDLPEEHVDRELLEHVKRKDYIPPSMEKDYLQALLQEFKRRFD